jgi:hypothetical protein
MLTGTVTLNRQSVPISEGYISKNAKVKFMFTDANGNKYLAKGLYTPGSGTTAATISGTYKLLPDDHTDEEHKGISDADDPTWSATAQTGPVDPDD